MRDVFPGQFRPTSEGFERLWSSCIFAVDANVLLNLYRYSPDTRLELDRALESVKERVFIPHQAAKEFLKNRLNVTAGQADEYTKAAKIIAELSATLSNKKKHPFLPEEHLPTFADQIQILVAELEKQKASLLNRLVNDEILNGIEAMFTGRTGQPLTDEQLQTLVSEGEKRYANDVPPGYKDGKKDGSGDPYRKFGDLIVWKQLMLKAKSDSKPIVFITDDKKEDWWLEQSGRTIGPRTELREEFIKEVSQDFWMYTVDKFIERTAHNRNTAVSHTVIAEIREVAKEAKEERAAIQPRIEAQGYPFKVIGKEELIERIADSERWSNEEREGFLGLHSYIKNYLGNAGYDYSSSYDLVHQLQEEGILEIYDHQGPGHERSVKAIRLLRKPSPKGAPPNNQLSELRSLLGSHGRVSDRGHR